MQIMLKHSAKYEDVQPNSRVCWLTSWSRIRLHVTTFRKHFTDTYNS